MLNVASIRLYFKNQFQNLNSIHFTNRRKVNHYFKRKKTNSTEILNFS